MEFIVQRRETDKQKDHAMSDGFKEKMILTLFKMVRQSLFKRIAIGKKD